MSMRPWHEDFELVVGLEVHAQLLMNSKAYSSDPNAYGDHPNTNVSPITLGHPGTLPVLNERTVELAIKLGLACGCDIATNMYFARKNYFYPDLPKGYQITQDKTPICTRGQIVILDADGNDKEIGITRIHMEEDAGKSIHDIDPFNTLIDLNRAGVPLLEIVSEPDLRSAEDAGAYLTEVRKLVRYLDICDGNMEEGSMRCDANISLRPLGSERFGTRAEVKNMNSIRNVQRAILHEAQRQAEILRDGGVIHQETRTFDAASGTTKGMRSKEMAHDYRYFPEPDLPPVTLTEARIDEVRKAMPALPRELEQKYIAMGLSSYDARVITDDKETALYYDAVLEHTKNYKAVANWITGDVRSWLKQRGKDLSALPITPQQLASLVELIDSGGISYSIAAQRLFPLMIDRPGENARTLAEQADLLHDDDEDELAGLVKETLQRFPDKVKAYRDGNKALLGLFMGEVMRSSGGKVDPRKANEVIKKALEE